MTEFEIMKQAFARVYPDLKVCDFPNEKSITFPIPSVTAASTTLELDFDAEGKLRDTYVWD